MMRLQPGLPYACSSTGSLQFLWCHGISLSEVQGLTSPGFHLTFFSNSSFVLFPLTESGKFLESGKREAEIIRPLSQLHFGGEGRAFLAITLHKLLNSKNALEYFNSIILGMLVPFSGRSWSISRLPEKMTNLKQFLSFASANPVIQVAGSVRSYSMKQHLHISISPSPLLITALWSHASELYKHPAEWLCITYINVF